MKTKKKFGDIRTGVIGVGSMGQHHARILNEISNLCGVSDVNEEQGYKISKKYSTQYFSKYEDLIKKADFLVVAVPTFLHKEVSEKIIESGKHLLIEKPLAKSINESQAILDKLKNSKSKLSVGHIERFNDTTIYAKANLVKGNWGEPIVFSATRYSLFPDRITDVGVLFDLTIHDVDMISYLANSKAKRVFALGSNRKHKDFEDNISLIIDYENGCRGVCQTSWLSPVKVRKLEISTDTNLIVLDHLSKEVEVLDLNSELGNKTNKEKLKITNSLENELMGSLEVIKNRKGMIVSGEEAIESIKIVEAAHISMVKGSVIDI